MTRDPATFLLAMFLASASTAVPAAPAPARPLAPASTASLTPPAPVPPSAPASPPALPTRAGDLEARDSFDSTTLDPRWKIDDPDGDDRIEVTGAGRLRVEVGGDEDAWRGRRGGAPFVLLRRPAAHVLSVETFVDLAAGRAPTPRSLGGIVWVDAGNPPGLPFELTLAIERREAASQVILQSPGVTLAREDVAGDALWLRLERESVEGPWRAWYRAAREEPYRLLGLFGPEDLPGGGLSGAERVGLFVKTWGSTSPARVEFDDFAARGARAARDPSAAARARREAPGVTFRSLLEEMVDRDRLARFPTGRLAYLARQASSYERASTGPGEPSWFANHDWSWFERVEERAGRREWVMLDAKGPGAITRMWMGGVPPYGTLRFYLDGAPEPVIEENVEDLLGGGALAGPPFSAIRGRGRNLYLPIPWARACEVTYDGPNWWEGRERGSRTWYVIGYRAYRDPTLAVKTFSRRDLEEARERLREVGWTLLHPAASLGEVADRSFKARRLAPGARVEVSLAGPAAVREITARAIAPSLAEALEKTWVEIDFDGERCVEAPAGHFFGSGAGLHPFRSWSREARPDGLLACRWVMPFRRAARVALANRSEAPLRVELSVSAGPWRWDERSMRFRARFHRDTFDVTAREGRDWPFVSIAGRGVYVGDTLAIRNSSRAWWGEGDEKIRVDGEPFPSIFGTGTEDYFGYSYGSPEFFEAPFHAQPTGAGNAAPGRTTDLRGRSLDAIPFTRSLRFDLEAWHWASCRMEYAATAYWYEAAARE